MSRSDTAKKDGLKFAGRRILDLSPRPSSGKAASASEFFFCSILA